MEAVTSFPLAISAVVPALMVLWYFRERDVFREPSRAVWRVFALGVASVIPAVMLANLLEIVLPATSDPWRSGFLQAFFQAAVPEDIAKFAVLLFVFGRFADFDEPMDGIVYGVAASMGFAAAENILYVSDGGLAAAVTRAATAVPSHGLHGVIMGYFLALAWFLPKRRPLHLFYGLAVPILLHGLYDFPLLVMPLLPEGSHATVWLTLAAFSVLILEGVVALALHSRVRSLQIVERATHVKNHHRLLAFHRAGSIRRRLPGWCLAHLGVLLLWGSALVVLAAASTALENGALPFGMLGGVTLLATGAGGVLIFRRAIARLNREDLRSPTPLATRSTSAGSSRIPSSEGEPGPHPGAS